MPTGRSIPGRSGRSSRRSSRAWRRRRSLPYASSLCGACYEVCPVEIDIPRVLVHLRARVVDTGRRVSSRKGGNEGALPGFFLAAGVRDRPAGGAASARAPLARRGRIERAALAPGRLDAARATCPAPPKETFREWWKTRARRPGDRSPYVGYRSVITAKQRRRAARDARGGRRPGAASSAGSGRRWRGRGSAAGRAASVSYRRAWRAHRGRGGGAVRRARRGVPRDRAPRAGAAELCGMCSRELCRERGARALGVPADLPAGMAPRSRRGGAGRPTRACRRTSSTGSTAP